MTSVDEPKLTKKDFKSDQDVRWCPGCGDYSILNSVQSAFADLGKKLHETVIISGIGCSSRFPYYMETYGFHTIHGRAPSLATGVKLSNPELDVWVITGDGDAMSIGGNHFIHAMRRNVGLKILLFNNRIYGLTKGQFSASADVGSKAKKGDANQQPPIDPVRLAITLGATFVARSFSGDKKQLVPLIKAAARHKGFALLDVLSPCVTFNDHEDSTKSYNYTRQFYHPAIHTDFIPAAEEIEASSEEGGVNEVTLHDGSRIKIHAVDRAYDPTDRAAAFSYLMDHAKQGHVVTGLLYLDQEKHDMHAVNSTAPGALGQLPYDRLNPGADKLDAIFKRYR